MAWTVSGALQRVNELSEPNLELTDSDHTDQGSIRSSSLLAKHTTTKSSIAADGKGEVTDISDNLIKESELPRETSATKEVTLITSPSSIADDEGLNTTNPATSIETTKLSVITRPSKTPITQADEHIQNTLDKKKHEESSSLNNDKENIITSLTKSFLKFMKSSTDTDEQSSPKFKRQLLHKANDDSSSTSLTGNEPKSGPSPDGFGPVHDFLPVNFPPPAISGRDNFKPLQSLERGQVSKHFSDKRKDADRHHEDSNFIGA